MKAIFKGGPYDSETTEIEAGVTRRQHWWNLTVDEIEKGTTRGPDYEYVYTGQFDDEGRAIYEFHDNR